MRRPVAPDSAQLPPRPLRPAPLISGAPSVPTSEAVRPRRRVCARPLFISVRSPGGGSDLLAEGEHGGVALGRDRRHHAEHIRFRSGSKQSFELAVDLLLAVRRSLAWLSAECSSLRIDWAPRLPASRRAAGHAALSSWSYLRSPDVGACWPRRGAALPPMAEHAARTSVARPQQRDEEGGLVQACCC